ncbi:MAG: hypothetical protein AAB899_03330 [Patescibacteria group bacterium]
MTDSVEFIQQHKVGDELLLLPSGEQVSIRKYFLEFKSWRGAPVPNTYNGKAVIDWNGEPVFAELAVLRLFQSHRWDGVWVDSYRGKFRAGLPDVVEPIELPQKQRKLIDSIRAKTGRSGGCWDVLAWKGNTTLFVELKRRKKDNVQTTQIEWLTAAIELGLTTNNFVLVEWDLSSRQLAFEYPEDRKFFTDLLGGGDEKRFEEDFSDYFDFRHPAIKRWEFNKTSKKTLAGLVKKYGEVCQLHIHPDCSKVSVWEPDHIIPLSTNELNKKLRHMERISDEKIPAQSFGSNHPKNLILACKRCNAFKKHRIIWPLSRPD